MMTVMVKTYHQISLTDPVTLGRIIYWWIPLKRLQYVGHWMRDKQGDESMQKANHYTGKQINSEKY